jgi:teichuronic acid biosynthesis glycosyltransferase TuaG
MVTPEFAPFFSVVIPTFNRAGLLGVALRSVLQQTYPDFELIVVDNGSTDETKISISRLEDSRIRYIFQEGSGSPASPRNHGILEARGNWIAFLDSDDIWEPRKLEAVQRKLSTTSYDFLSHQQRLVNSQGQIRGFMGPQEKNLTYQNLLLTENTIATSSVAIRTEFLRSNNLMFNESTRYAAVEDYDLWLRVLAAGGRPGVIDGALGTNIEAQGHMGVPSLFFKNLHNLFKDHAWKVQRFCQNSKKLEKRLFAGVALRNAMNKARQKNFLQTIFLFWQALCLCPSEVRRYVALRFRQRRDRRARSRAQPK